MNLSSLAPSDYGSSTVSQIDDIGNVTLLPSTTGIPDHHDNIDQKNRSVLYILVPLVTVGVVALLTAMVSIIFIYLIKLLLLIYLFNLMMIKYMQVIKSVL